MDDYGESESESGSNWEGSDVRRRHGEESEPS